MFICLLACFTCGARFFKRVLLGSGARLEGWNRPGMAVEEKAWEGLGWMTWKYRGWWDEMVVERASY